MPLVVKCLIVVGIWIFSKFSFLNSSDFYFIFYSVIEQWLVVARSEFLLLQWSMGLQNFSYIGIVLSHCLMHVRSYYIGPPSDLAGQFS